MNLTDNTLLLLGTPKCGSTSIWKFLDKHPQIHSSIVKEALFCYEEGIGKKLTRKKYLDFWDSNAIKNKDVLVDGTVNWWRPDTVRDCGVFDLIKDLEVKRVCCLYTIRTPYIEAWRSRLILHLQFNLDGEKPHYVDKYGMINFKQVEELIHRGFFAGIKAIENIVAKHDILVLKLNEIEKKQKDIYNFLGVSDNHIEKIGVLNKTRQELIKHPVVKIINRFLDKHKDFIESQERLDSKRIEDWRSDAK